MQKKKKQLQQGLASRVRQQGEKLKIHSGFTVQFSLSIRHRLGRLFLVEAKSF